MTRLERTTVSPAPRSSAGCSPRASRASAAALSPCEPVATARIARFGQLARPLRRDRPGRPATRGTGAPACSPVERAVACATRACVDTLRPSGTMRAPVAARDLAEHPAGGARSTRTSRPRPPARRAPTMASSALPTPSSLPVGPRASMFVESLKSRSTPSRASSSKRGDVERLAVRRGLVELEVAGVHDESRVGADGERRRVGDRVRHADGLDLERTRPARGCRGFTLAQVDVLEDLVLGRALAHEAERVRRARTRARRTAARSTGSRRCGPRGRASRRGPAIR